MTPYALIPPPPLTTVLFQVGSLSSYPGHIQLGWKADGTRGSIAGRTWEGGREGGTEGGRKGGKEAGRDMSSTSTHSQSSLPPSKEISVRIPFAATSTLPRWMSVC